ncbi:MAG TPA: GNAT family N-acetyltransferase [Acidimicrobiia bacterium]
MEEDAPLLDMELPAGRLVVRPVRPGDGRALGELYGALPLEDRYHRFFSFYEPSADFLDHMAGVREEGGDGLVAVLDDRRIVGEATYFLLPSGAGEFALAVAPDWRGWLAPYLLDALARRAGARGVPSLQADVLMENAPMLALVRARGFVTLDHSGPVVRVAIGTSERMPRWSEDHHRPRVLVEAAGAHWRAEHDVRSADFEVAVCPGPGVRCPALRGEQCPLAAGADAIVVALDREKPKTKALLQAHRTLHPSVPVTTVDAVTPDRELIALLERLTGTRPSGGGAEPRP